MNIALTPDEVRTLLRECVTFAAFVPVAAVYCFGPVWVARWKQRRRSGA